MVGGGVWQVEAKEYSVGGRERNVRVIRQNVAAIRRNAGARNWYKHADKGQRERRKSRKYDDSQVRKMEQERTLGTFEREEEENVLPR